LNRFFGNEHFLCTAAAALLLGSSILSCNKTPHETESPSIVLVMIDTLRADRLGCYGFDGETSPFISGLAKEGVLFTSVLAASPWTGPSVSAVLTGKYPDEIGIHDLKDPLPISATTLAQSLKKKGYTTAAVISNAIAGPDFGHNRGYDYFYFERYKDKKGNTPPRPVFTADRVTDKALEWLNDSIQVSGRRSARKRDQPFFLYVHYTDPHEPYIPPLFWKERYMKEEYGVGEDLLLEAAFTRIPLTPDQLKGVSAHYEAEIAFTDHEVGRLIESLPPDTLVVLTSDHGEEFFEHRRFLHGQSLFQELLHVPLIFRGPGIPADVIVSDPVSHVDITPTLLDLAGLAEAGKGPGRNLSGQSLSRYFEKKPRDRERDEPRPLFAVLETQKKHCIAVKRGPWKLLFYPRVKKLRLFNLDTDPGEKQDLSRENRKIVSSLIRFLQEREQSTIPTPPPESSDLEKQREEELRAIGYVE